MEKGLLCVSERTMSDLQIGQVRRRVVSQGVLRSNVSIHVFKYPVVRMGRNSHASLVELVPARQAHNPRDAVDIFFQANDALALLAAISAPPFC